MWAIKKPIQTISNTSSIKRAYLIILFLISGCAQQGSTHGHDDTLSGTWEYHTTSYDYTAQEYVDELVLVKVSDYGDSIFIDHCLHDKHMSFTFDPNENVFKNKSDQKMEVNHDDKISSLSVPDFSYLIKSEKSHDLLNAGSITIQSENLPSISLSNNVCAQRTIIKDSETVLLHLSIPFKETYIDMTLEVKDMNDTNDNLVSATFTSPNFRTYYDFNTINALSGQINFQTLTDTHAKFDFDIKLEGQFSNFVIDHFVGTADVKL